MDTDIRSLARAIKVSPEALEILKTELKNHHLTIINSDLLDDFKKASLEIIFDTMTKISETEFSTTWLSDIEHYIWLALEGNLELWAEPEIRFSDKARQLFPRLLKHREFSQSWMLYIPSLGSGRRNIHQIVALYHVHPVSVEKFKEVHDEWKQRLKSRTG